ncbi:MAG TPA: type II secretion system F family protein [Candidatus Competibacteraceae bacterium]|nr:type II secretion system F family protein [Candidatus Competibacteraceae bacterium]
MATQPKLAKKKLPQHEDLVFVWQGTDKRGVKVKGELRGRNSNVIRAELMRQGIVPKSVKKKPKSINLGDSIKSKDIMLFTRQLATMLQSGIAIVQALDMVGHSVKKPKLKKMILEIKADVESGSRFAEALGKHPLYFNDLYRSLVKAGEEAGVLERVLHRIAVYLEKVESLKAKVKKAMLYPAIVLLAAFVVTAIIMIYVIPVFEDLFKSFGADLPAFTRLVIEISKIFQAYWWAMIGGIVGGIVGFIEARKRSRKMREALDRITLRLPLFGNIATLSANARFARTLSTMFAAGVPLVDAMTSVAGATGNVVYEHAVLEMRDAVSIGQQLNFAMRQSKLFPDMVVQMVAIGEEAGSLSDMLAKVADFYEEELDNTIAALTTMIEPMIMAFLGVLIGGLIIAMYLPIFKLAAAI